MWRSLGRNPLPEPLIQMKINQELEMIHQISFWGRIRIRFFQGSDMDPVGTLGVIRIRVDPQPLFIL